MGLCDLFSALESASRVREQEKRARKEARELVRRGVKCAWCGAPADGGIAYRLEDMPRSSLDKSLLKKPWKADPSVLSWFNHYPSCKRCGAEYGLGIRGSPAEEREKQAQKEAKDYYRARREMKKSRKRRPRGGGSEGPTGA